MPVIRLPSSTTPGVLDLYAEVPKDMSVPHAVRLANHVIWEANMEDAESPMGGCADGASVEDCVKSRLASHGFVFLDIACTLPWDVFQEEEPPKAA